MITLQALPRQTDGQTDEHHGNSATIVCCTPARALKHDTGIKIKQIKSAHHYFVASPAGFKFKYSLLCQSLYVNKLFVVITYYFSLFFPSSTHPAMNNKFDA